MDALFDSRTECFSILHRSTVTDYLSLVEHAHASKGGIKGQRDALRTTSARRIRERMVSDIRRGAVLPPVVIGIVLESKRFDELKQAMKNGSILQFLTRKELSKVTIIDGMQRTTALMEAHEQDSTSGAREMRVEFWVARRVENLIYRMLVLNTGQVPWTLARQLSVVFAPLLADIQTNVPGIKRMFTPDQPGRRVQHGEFSADSLIELYIAFSLRKTSVDTKEALSDEFSKLDFVENLSEGTFQDKFYTFLSILTEMDEVFSRYDTGSKGKLVKGRNIFDSQPARIGLAVAMSQHVIGRPAMEREEAIQRKRLKQVSDAATAFCAKLKKMPEDKLGDFLRLEVLSEMLDKRVGQVGRYERSVFVDAFSVLIQEGFDVPSMEPCWRAN